MNPRPDYLLAEEFSACPEEGFVKNRLRVTCTNLINRIHPKSSGFGSTSAFIVPEVDAKAKTSESRHAKRATPHTHDLSANVLRALGMALRIRSLSNRRGGGSGLCPVVEKAFEASAHLVEP
jgi:hypothetical protein